MSVRGKQYLAITIQIYDIKPWEGLRVRRNNSLIRRLHSGVGVQITLLGSLSVSLHCKDKPGHFTAFCVWQAHKRITVLSVQSVGDCLFLILLKPAIFGRYLFIFISTPFPCKAFWASLAWWTTQSDSYKRNLKSPIPSPPKQEQKTSCCHLVKCLQYQ